MSDFGKRPELGFIPIDRLSVDLSYQRTLESRRSQQLIDNIVARFRWSAFQAILATPDGKDGWRVIDGQHRAEAARRLGILDIPAVIVEAASVEEEARAFVEANQSRVAINQYALFHAKLAGGDEEAAELKKLCDKAGIVVPRYPIPADKIKSGETLALGTLSKIARSRPPALALLIFNAVAEAYRGIPGGLVAPFFSAAAFALDEAEPIKRIERSTTLATFFRKRQPSDTLKLAQRRKESYGGTLARNLAEIFKKQEQIDQHRAEHDKDEGGFIRRPTRDQLMGGR